MAEQADAERLEELNRNKDAYEARESGSDRSLRDDVNENYRRQQIADQREKEIHEQTESSAKQIAEGRAKYREEQAEKSRKALEDANRERDVRRGYDSTGKGVQYGDLNVREQRIVADEVEQSAGILKKKREVFVEERTAQQKNTYFRQASTGQQVKDILMGTKEPWKPKDEKKEVKPISTFLGGQKHKAGERIEAAKKNFIAETMAPLKGVQQARDRRREGHKTEEGVLDPFRGLTQSQQQARTRKHRPREGTGMLFSEGFFNPPARANPPKKGKKGAKTRAPRSLLDIDLDRIF
jgi:hypothetical protein